MAHTDSIPKVEQAAEWIAAQQAEVMPRGFELQKLTVLVRPDGNQDPLAAATVEFTWQDDHYTYTVQ